MEEEKNPPSLLNLLLLRLQTRPPADGGSGADPLELEAALQQLQVTPTQPGLSSSFEIPPVAFCRGRPGHRSPLSVGPLEQAQGAGLLSF